jgi:transposase
VADVEIMARVERRRKWTAEEKAALLAEVEAEGGKVAVVARRHRVSESLLYNWRSAWKTSAALARTPQPLEFVPLGVFGRAGDEGPAMLAAPADVPSPERSRRTTMTMEERVGVIEVALPGGARVRVDAFVNEKALRRVFRAIKGSL